MNLWKNTAKVCNSKHNPSEDLVLSLTPDTGFENASVVWFYSDQVLRLNASNTYGTINDLVLVIAPGTIPQSGTLTVRIAIPTNLRS